MARIKSYKAEKAASKLENQIINYEEFKGKNEAEQKKLLTDYRKHFSNKDILAAWKISHNTYYKIIEKLKLPKASRTNNKKPVKEKTITLYRYQQNLLNQK